jgi:hypothetical protein
MKNLDEKNQGKQTKDTFQKNEKSGTVKQNERVGSRTNTDSEQIRKGGKQDVQNQRPHQTDKNR